MKPFTLEWWLDIQIDALKECHKWEEETYRISHKNKEYIKKCDGLMMRYLHLYNWIKSRIIDKYGESQ